MTIRNTKTQIVTKDVTPEAWEGMKSRGMHINFVIVSRDDEADATPKPKEVVNKSYQNILKEATKLHKLKKYSEAKVKYLEAQAIKPTPLITEKIEDIEAQLMAN